MNMNSANSETSWVFFYFKNEHFQYGVGQWAIFLVSECLGNRFKDRTPYIDVLKVAIELSWDENKSLVVDIFQNKTKS